MVKIKRRKSPQPKKRKKVRWELTPEKFIKFEEADRLREITEAKAEADRAKGKTTWPKVWMTVDLALNTGMRVAELTNITPTGALHSPRPGLPSSEGHRERGSALLTNRAGTATAHAVANERDGGHAAREPQPSADKSPAAA